MRPKECRLLSHASRKRQITRCDERCMVAQENCPEFVSVMEFEAGVKYVRRNSVPLE